MDVNTKSKTETTEEYCEDGEGEDAVVIDFEISTDLLEETETIAVITTETKCRECGEEFQDVESLKEHINLNHCKHECEKCTKRFYTPGLLRQHLRNAHLESMNLRCPICDKVFKVKYTLQQHLYTHSEERRFLCSYEGCNSKFRHVNTLRQHEAMHSLKNRKECPICKKCVTRLQQHIATHSLESRFSCEECGKSYAAEKFLNEHKKSHEGITHTCEICSSVFRNKSSLYKHCKTIHNHSKFPCSICGKSFRRKDNLMVHIRKVHKMGVHSLNSLRSKREYVKLMQTTYGDDSSCSEEVRQVLEFITSESEPVDESEICSSDNSSSYQC